MLREYPNNVTFHDRGFIEQLGGFFLDSVAMGHELRLPRDAWRTFYPCELIHRGVADLTLHRFVVVHHRKCESQPLVVVSPYSATSQRHPKSPFQDNQRRMRRPIVSVESLRRRPDRCLFLTRLRHPAMSPIRSLSGETGHISDEAFR